MSKYNFITNLPDDWPSLASPKLQTLSQVWREQKTELEPADINQFQQKLVREFAIETGLLEGLYVLDRGTTETLIQQGFAAAYIPHTGKQSPKHVANMLDAQKDAIEGLFDFVARRRSLSVSYIKELHRELTRYQDYTDAVTPDGVPQQIKLIKGEFKKLPNNPRTPEGVIHQYCPPEHTSAEMDQLITWHLEHEERNVPPEIEAAWLHHRFTQIHPFQDGNGRVARCLASLVFIRAELFPLVVLSAEKQRYIEALVEADSGRLAGLTTLFAGLQTQRLLRALSAEEEVTTTPARSEIIKAARAKLVRKKEQERRRLNSVKEFAVELIVSAQNRLQEAQNELENELGGLVEGRLANVAAEVNPEGERTHWHQRDIIEIAQKIGYFANTADFNVWARLSLYFPSPCDIVFSIHTLGRSFLGTLVANAIFVRRASDDGGQSNTVQECGEPFHFNYLDDKEQTRIDFLEWLEQSQAIGLSIWQRSF